MKSLPSLSGWFYVLYMYTETMQMRLLKRFICSPSLKWNYR